MTTHIYTSSFAAFEPPTLVELVIERDVSLFDTRPYYLTKGNRLVVGSARWFKSVLGDRYEGADYITAKLRPEVTRDIILGRDKPITILHSARDHDDLVAHLRGLGFIVDTFGTRHAPLPLFDSIVGGQFSE